MLYVPYSRPIEAKLGTRIHLGSGSVLGKSRSRSERRRRENGAPRAIYGSESAEGDRLGNIANVVASRRRRRRDRGGANGVKVRARHGNDKER